MSHGQKLTPSMNHVFIYFQEGSEERPVSVTKQRLGTMGDRPARPSLIEQVLNQKRLVSGLFLCCAITFRFNKYLGFGLEQLPVITLLKTFNVDRGRGSQGQDGDSTINTEAQSCTHLFRVCYHPSVIQCECHLPGRCY